MSDPPTELAVQAVRVEAHLVRIPFRRPFVTATSEFTHRKSWILTLWDREGRRGFGEATLDPAATETADAGLARLVRETVAAFPRAGLPDPRDLIADGEPGRALLAACDGALASIAAALSAAGQTSKGSVQAPALDGSPSVAVNAVIGFGGPEAGAEAAAQAVDVGFSTLKLKAGAERETDALVERIRAVRRAVGPDVRLRIDANGVWDLDTAMERIQALERFRIEYVEQPLAPWDLAGHARLREARLGVAIALDESIDSEYAAREALAAGAADVLVVKPARVGGPARVAAIAASAADAGVPVVLSTFFETGVGIAAALRAAAGLPNVGGAGRALAHGLATGGILAHDLLTAPLPIVEGRMPVPAGPELDETALERYTIEAIEARA